MQTEFSKITGTTGGAGATCEHSNQSQRTNGKSMSSAVGSRAKTCPQRDREMESTEAAAVSTPKCSGPLAFFDHESSAWKTFQRCFFREWEPYAETWPASGIVANGRLYPLPDLARHTSAQEFSYWPTAMASDQLRLGISREAFLKSLDRNRRLGHGAGPASGNLVSQFQVDFDGCPSPAFAEWLMGFPPQWTETDGEDSETQ